MRIMRTKKIYLLMTLGVCTVYLCLYNHSFQTRNFLLPMLVSSANDTTRYRVVTTKPQSSTNEKSTSNPFSKQLNEKSPINENRSKTTFYGEHKYKDDDERKPREHKHLFRKWEKKNRSPLIGAKTNIDFKQNRTIRLSDTFKRFPKQKKRKIWIKPNVIPNVTSCPSFVSYKSTRDPGSDLEREHYPDWKLFDQNRVVKNVNCRLLFENNTEEMNSTNLLMNQQKVSLMPPSIYPIRTKNCKAYIRTSGYITSSLSEEEKSFPIAYSILVYKDVQQVETLLRSIYRPQNIYCIHVDGKSKKDFRTALRSIAKCFDNVFLSSTSVKVFWGMMSVVSAEIACIRDLWAFKQWKYFINLTGQEFPLRTNLEIVKILKAYNGSNDIGGTIKWADKSRWKLRNKPPRGIRLVKGSVHIAASRGYIDYLLHNETARELMFYVQRTEIPDETLFSTLNHNPHLEVPGSFKGDPDSSLDCNNKPFMARFKNWDTIRTPRPCLGKRVRNLCIFGIGDLPELSTRQELFANKFYIDYQPFALQCMEELIFNRTRDEYFRALEFDTTRYESLKFIQNTF